MYWKKAITRIGITLIIWLWGTVLVPFIPFLNDNFDLNDQINWLFGAIWAISMFTD